MTLFLNIIEFLVLIWLGYLLGVKARFKLWEVLITQLLVGTIFLFGCILLEKAELI